KMKKIQQLGKLKRLNSKDLKMVIAGSNGITDGTNLPSIPKLAPSTYVCSGGCTATYTPNGTVVTANSGTVSYDYF
ncbi:TPA: hypothetical protein ACW72O_003650, partial [Elizabethkingia anophelis]